MIRPSSPNATLTLPLRGRLLSICRFILYQSIGYRGDRQQPLTSAPQSKASQSLDSDANAGDPGDLGDGRGRDGDGLVSLLFPLQPAPLPRNTSLDRIRSRRTGRDDRRPLERALALARATAAWLWRLPPREHRSGPAAARTTLPLAPEPLAQTAG